MTSLEKYGAAGSAFRQVIVGGFIADMKKIGMANHNDESAKRVQLEDAEPSKLSMLESLVKHHKNVMGV